MDTITKDRLRAEWSDWFRHQDIDFDTEWPHATREIKRGEIDVERVRVTAYLRGDTGYKLIRKHYPGIRQMPHAWEMLVPVDTMMREHLHRAACILEASPIGLESIFQQKLPLIGSDRRRFGIVADPCDEWLGPPPWDASYFEIDWNFRRSSADWAGLQTISYIFGAERVRRCVAGMRAVGISDQDHVIASLGISHTLFHRWLEAGTEFVLDEFTLMDAHRKALPKTQYAERVRPILELGSYEKFSPPAGYWTVEEARLYNKRVVSACS